MLERAHFISNSSFIEFQTVEFQHVSSLTFAQVFWVLAGVIQVFQVFLSSSLAEFEFWESKLIEFLSFELLVQALWKITLICKKPKSNHEAETANEAYREEAVNFDLKLTLLKIDSVANWVPKIQFLKNCHFLWCTYASFSSWIQ